MKRREAIKLFAAAGIAFQPVTGTLSPAQFNDAASPREPTQTQSLPKESKDVLWTIFQFIGKTWRNGSFCTLDRRDFDAIIDLKTEQPPSYAAEYRHAIAVFHRLREVHGEDQALHGLFFNHPDQAVKKFVIAELIELQLVHGGFRLFGFRNFKGFMGGPFGLQTRPPYHPMETR